MKIRCPVTPVTNHFFYTDRNPEDSASDKLLVEGVSAMTAFMAEVLGSELSLEYAGFGDRALLVHRTDELIAFLIADRATQILESAFNQFINEFSRHYDEQLKKQRYNVAYFTEIKDI